MGKNVFQNHICNPSRNAPGALRDDTKNGCVVD